MATVSPEPTVKTQSRGAKTLKTNLILAAILAVSASAAAWYEYKHRPKAEKTEAVSKRLLPALEGAQVESVQLINPAAKTDVLLVCDKECATPGFSSEWTLNVGAKKFRADSGSSNSLYSQVSSASPTERFDVSGANDPVLKQYALDPTGRRIEVKIKGKDKPYVIMLGEHSPVGTDVYAAAYGPDLSLKEVTMVAAGLTEAFGHDQSHWRSKKIFELTPADVKEVAFSGTGDSFKLVKDADGQQWFIEPGHMATNSEAVDTYLTGLTVMTATGFLEDHSTAVKSKYGMGGAPKNKVTITTIKGDGISAELFEKSGKPAEYYGRITGNPSVAKFDTAAIQKFKKSKEDFRFKRLLTSADRFKVARVVFAPASGKQLALLQDKGAWTSTELANADSAAIDKFLTGLGSLKIQAFKGRSLPAGHKLHAKLELYDEKGQALHKYAFFKKADQWVVKLLSGEYAELDKATAKDLNLSVSAFQKTEAAPVATPPKKP